MEPAAAEEAAAEPAASRSSTDAQSLEAMEAAAAVVQRIRQLLDGTESPHKAVTALAELQREAAVVVVE